MASLFSAIKSQAMAALPGLIQTAEPQIEEQLRSALKTIKASKPKEAQVFLTNWKKLDVAVQQELAGVAPAPQLAGRRRRKTRKVSKKRTR